MFWRNQVPILAGRCLCIYRLTIPTSSQLYSPCTRSRGAEPTPFLRPESECTERLDLHEHGSSPTTRPLRVPIVHQLRAEQFGGERVGVLDVDLSAVRPPHTPNFETRNTRCARQVVSLYKASNAQSILSDEARKHGRGRGRQACSRRCRSVAHSEGGQRLSRHTSLGHQHAPRRQHRKAGDVRKLKLTSSRRMQLSIARSHTLVGIVLLE